ncbi:hypothetical protein LBMAG53_04060 [Planctomycetota bacterium]|nr:hypothetical protein LBMAG53_04060 [Planctomycetota bacterium]
MRLLALLLVASALTAGEPGEGPVLRGMDLLGPAKQVAKALSTPTPSPWSDDLAGLTSSDPQTQAWAIRGLIAHGAKVLPDLVVLAKDRDPGVRGRICTVLAGIGGSSSTELALALSDDPDRRVRELAILALIRCQGPAIWPRLKILLDDPEPTLRSAAAEATIAHPEVDAIAALARHGEDVDDLARRAKGVALRRIVNRPAAVPELIRLLAPGISRGESRTALLEAAAAVADPRLCPALTTVAGGDEPLPALLAVRALAASGDARCLERLAALAAADRTELATAAAETMRRLTGHLANAGPAWSIWWRDHAAMAARLAERDALVATWHDPQSTIEPADLAKFTPNELMPLIDALVGEGQPSVAQAPWWPARAWTVVRRDDPKRWIDPLAARLRVTSDAEYRTRLVILLDALAGPRDEPLFKTLGKELTDLEEQERKRSEEHGLPPPDRGGERLALAAALARRAK